MLTVSISVDARETEVITTSPRQTAITRHHLDIQRITGAQFHLNQPQSPEINLTARNAHGEHFEIAKATPRSSKTWMTTPFNTPEESMPQQ